MSKMMKRLSVVAVAVLCTFVLVACGSASSGYSKQQDLAKAAVNMVAMNTLSSYGEGATFNDMMKMAYTDGTPSFFLDLARGMQEAEMNSKKAVHNAKMKGEWVTEFNADGTAKTKLSGEALQTYKDAYNDAVKTSKSFKFLEAQKDEAATAAAVAGQAGSSAIGVVSAIEVWTVKYEYTPYTNGVAGTKVTVDHTSEDNLCDELVIVKIGSKWYNAEIDFSDILSGLGRP